MIVYDASGSMWAQVDGVNKIVIAREVMADLLGTYEIRYLDISGRTVMGRAIVQVK